MEARWYHWIYGSDDELLRLQDFDNDLSEVPDVIVMHWIRYLLFFMSVAMVAISAWNGGFMIFLVYFTLWTALVTMISCGLSVVVTSTENIHVRLGLLAAHHIFYSASIFMNCVTVFVYWALLHDDCLVKFGASDRDIAIRCYMSHTIPGIVCLGNTWLTNSKLSPRFISGLIVFGLFYAVMNYRETKRSGKPVYPFLTWEGFDSILIIAAMIFVFSLFYLLLCWIDGLVKHQSLTLLLERRQRRKSRKTKEE